MGLMLNLKKPKSFDFMFRVFGWCANTAEPLKDDRISHDQLRLGLTGKKAKHEVCTNKPMMEFCRNGLRNRKTPITLNSPSSSASSTI